MQINNNPKKFSNINNNRISYKGYDARNVIKTLSDSDSLMSTIVLESFVTGGRGINAYKRGGVDEFRERFIDDVVSAVFWMKGVDIFNSLGNKFGKKVLKLPTTDFDSGQDALRTPFKNLSNDIIKKTNDKKAAKSIIKKLAIFKFSKIISATLLSTSVIGYIMPLINQKITDAVMKNKKKQHKSAFHFSFEKFNKRITENKTQSFKGNFINNMTQVTHELENNTICKMLTNDAGIITGRTLSARNKDEGLEYLFRDTSSLFFYFASTPLICNLLQKLTNSKGLTEIDPVSANDIHKNLVNQFKNNNSLSTKEFERKTLGILDKNSEKIIETLPFKSDVISLEEFKKNVKDKDLINRAREMASLQPSQAEIGEVLTKQQVQDIFKNGSVTKPEFMKNLYKNRFGNIIFERYRFISMKKITKFRDNIDKYVQSIIDKANKNNNGIVDVEFLENINKKSFKLSAGFRLFAMSISALALGLVIPKLQYAITEYRTGSKSAPMFRQYEN